MRKVILSLISLLFVTQAMAQVEETVEFDFSHPYSLNFSPALPNLQDTDGNLIQLTRYTVSDGPVTISFGYGQGNLGATIYRSGNYYTLNIRKWSTITFTVSGDCQLTNIQFTGTNGLICSSDQPGRYDPSGNRWYNYNSSNVTTVTLEQGPNEDSWCPKITVTYLRAPAALVLYSTSPSEGSTVQSFKTMELRFNTTVGKINPSAVMGLTGTGIEGIKSLLPTINGNIVKLAVADEITTDGEFTVNVSKRAFESTEGAVYADSVKVKFKVRADRATFKPTAISPAEGTYGALPQQIRLTFNNFVKIGTGIVKFVQKGGTLSFPANLSVDSVDKKVAIISHDYGLMTDAGEWKVEIPEKTFHNPFMGDDADDRWNPAMVLNYTVDASQPISEDSETMAEARRMLLLTGVGYPKTTTATYKALSNLVKSSETPSDEDVAAAMLNLYNETDVTLPEVGKWYNIVGINDKGNKLYLTFNSDKTKVEVGNNVANAAAFKVKSVKNDSIVFVTKEGKFLHIPTVLPLHEGTTDANLTDQETIINSLKFSKFLASSVKDIAPAALYGKFTIYGNLGKINGQYEFAYAMLDFDDSGIATYPNWPLTFDSSKSNAFILEESSEPLSGDVIIPTVEIRPSVINKPGDELLLVINGPRKTTIANAQLVSFKKDGKKVDFYDTILTPEYTENQFSVNTEGLEKGTYTLDMPLGTFNFEAVTGKKVQPVALSIEFTIRSNEDVVIGDVTPTATLSTTELIAAGERLVLTIGNVARATLNASAEPYFRYADGVHYGERVDVNSILSVVAGTTNSFTVNTVGLSAGKYTLVIPKKSFTYQAIEAGETVSDITLTVDFNVLGFKNTFNSYIVFMPTVFDKPDKVFLRDVDLNRMILYVYDYMQTGGLEPNPNVKVWIVYSLFGTPILSGHFEKFTALAEEYGIEYNNTYAIKFVPDKYFEGGELDNFPGMYGYYCEAGAFGDANYGKWLRGDKSIKPEDCTINPACNLISFDVDNNKSPATGISTITDKTDDSVYDLQGRRQPTSGSLKSGMYIVNGKKMIVK